jgi:Phage Tail Collar Domain
MSGYRGLPIGFIIEIETRFMGLNGQTLLIKDYPELYEVIKKYFGESFDGVTFKLPDKPGFSICVR